MTKTITSEELKRKLDSHEKFVLVDALGPNSFKSGHLPGALNVPWDPNFMNTFRERIGEDKNAEIVVYCSSPTCQNSIQASKVLDSHGFTNVSHYAGGLAGWQEAGFVLDRNE